MLFGHGEPANSFMPPQVPFYDKNTPGIQYDMAKAKAELAQSAYPKGFKVEMLVGSGDQTANQIGQILQQALKPLGIDITLQDGGHEHGVRRHPGAASTSSASPTGRWTSPTRTSS